MPSDAGPVPSRHGPADPIDLLELDIDLRLTDLWREADITENLDVASAFLMRAAYGKGYCDALTEDAPGLLLPRARVRGAEAARADAAEA